MKRLKRGLSTTQPFRGDEFRVLKAWLTERQRMKPAGKALFISERRQPLSRKTAWVIIRDYGKDAGLGVASHPHMLRHACGYALADQGRGYAADSGLLGASEHSAHGALYREQSGTV